MSLSKTLSLCLLFLISGFISSFLYYTQLDCGGVFYPGILFTITTLLVFRILRIPLQRKRAVIYFILMNVVYLGMWFLTIFTVWVSFITGILTAGGGSLLIFKVINSYITKCSYSETVAFSLGGLAFLIVDILYWSFETAPMQYLVNVNDFEGTFGDVFIFWHSIVGTYLIFRLRKNEKNLHN